MRVELSPQERRAHEESSRRRREIEQRQILEETQRAIGKGLSPEDIERAQRAAKEREQNL